VAHWNPGKNWSTHKGILSDGYGRRGDLTHATVTMPRGCVQYWKLKVLQVAMHLPWIIHLTSKRFSMTEHHDQCDPSKVIRNLLRQRHREIGIGKENPDRRAIRRRYQSKRGPHRARSHSGFLSRMLAGFKCVPGAFSSTTTPSFWESRKSPQRRR